MEHAHIGFTTIVSDQQGNNEVFSYENSLRWQSQCC